eukprot:403336365
MSQQQHLPYFKGIPSATNQQTIINEQQQQAIMNRIGSQKNLLQQNSNQNNPHSGVPMHSEIRKKQREENFNKLKSQMTNNGQPQSQQQQQIQQISSNQKQSISVNKFSEDPHMKKLRMQMDKEREQINKMKENQKRLLQQQQQQLQQQSQNMQIQQQKIAEIQQNQNHLASNTQRHFISPRIATSSSLLSKGFSVKSNNFLNLNLNGQGQIINSKTGVKQNTNLTERTIGTAPTTTGNISARRYAPTISQESQIIPVIDGSSQMNPPLTARAQTEPITLPLSYQQTQKTDLEYISSVRNNNQNNANSDHASQGKVSDEMSKSQQQMLQAKIMNFKQKIEMKINDIAQQIQEGRVDINVNQLETAISEVMGGGNRNNANNDIGTDEMNTPRGNNSNKFIKRAPSLKSKRSNQEDEEENKDRIRILSPNQFNNNANSPHRRLQTAKKLTNQASNNPQKQGQIDSFEEDSGIIQKVTQNQNNNNDNNSLSPPASNRKNKDNQLRPFSGNLNIKDKQQLLSTQVKNQSNDTSVAVHSNQSQSKQLSTSDLRKKLLTLETNEEQILKQQKDREIKDKIDEYLNDMFEMDYHFQKLVVRYNQVKNKKQFKKVKKQKIQKIGIDKQKKSKQQCKPVMIQNIDELSNELFPKQLLINKNSSNDALTSSERGSNQLVNSNRSGTRLTSGNLNPSIIVKNPSGFLQRSNSGQFPSQVQARPFSAIRHNLFDNLRFFYNNQISGFPSLYRKEFTMVIFEQISSHAHKNHNDGQQLNNQQQQNQSNSTLGSNTNGLWLQRIDLVKLKSQSPYSKQSMLKEFKSNQFRGFTVDTNVLKEALSINTNHEQKTVNRDQEIDDFLLNDQQYPDQSHTFSQINKQTDQTQDNINDKSFATPRIKIGNRNLGVDEGIVGPPQRILSMNSTFKLQFTQTSSFKRKSIKSKSNPKLVFQQRRLKDNKTLIIIKKEELDEKENQFMQVFMRQKQAQKSLLRQITGAGDSTVVNSQNISIDQNQLAVPMQTSKSQRVGVIIDETSLSDSILHHYWKQINSKQYFIMSNTEVLDKLDTNLLDDDKIIDYLIIFNLDIKYQIYEVPIEKKQEDLEFNEMLNQVDNLQEQSTNFLDLDLINYIVSQEHSQYEDTISGTLTYEEMQFYKQTQNKIRKPIQKAILQYVNQMYFNQRYDSVIQYMSKKKTFEYKNNLWYSDRKICQTRDHFKHSNIETYSPMMTFLFHRNFNTSQQDLIKMIFQPAETQNIFYLLFDAEEDFELQLTLDRIYHFAIKQREQFIAELKKQGLKVAKQLRISPTKKLENRALQRKVIFREQKRHKSLGYDQRQLGPKTFTMHQDSMKSDTSFRSSAFSKVQMTDNSVSESELNNKQSKLSTDYIDFLPLVRKHALRKNYGKNRKFNSSKALGDQMFIKHRIFKARITLQKPNSDQKSSCIATPRSQNIINASNNNFIINHINQINQQRNNSVQTAVLGNIENYDLSSSDSNSSSSSSSSISSLNEAKYLSYLPKRLSGISKASEQISIFSPLKTDLLGGIVGGSNITNNQFYKREFMVNIQVGALESRKDLPPPPKNQQRMIKKFEKRYSRMLKKVSSMDGILIDKFGYESLLKVDDSAHRYIFEIFLPIEIKFDGDNFDTDVNNGTKDNQSEDHLTTDSSLRGQEIDKYTDYDVKIQKQQLKKFIQQQKLRTKQKFQSKHTNKKLGSQIKQGSGNEVILNQNTQLSNNGQTKTSKNSLANLHHNYTTIGTYYRNLRKKQRYDKLENQGGEVLSGEEFEEDDENNFYLQMRNNLKIMELLSEVGAVKKKSSSKNIRTSNSIMNRAKEAKKFREDTMKNRKISMITPDQDKIQEVIEEPGTDMKSKEEDSLSDQYNKGTEKSNSLFSHSDDNYDDFDQDHKLSRGGRRHSIKSYTSRNLPQQINQNIISGVQRFSHQKSNDLKVIDKFNRNGTGGLKTPPVTISLLNNNFVGSSTARINNQEVTSMRRVSQNSANSLKAGGGSNKNTQTIINHNKNYNSLDFDNLNNNNQISGIEAALKLGLSKINNSSFRKKIAEAKKQKLATAFLKNTKANHNIESTKRTMFVRDQENMKKQIVAQVKNQDLTNFKQILHKFELSLDTYRDPLGNTLLSISTQLGNRFFVELLLQQGADPNISNNSGNVPLHYAINNGFNKITDLLMEYGANERVRNKEGKTPWEKID